MRNLIDLSKLHLDSLEYIVRPTKGAKDRWTKEERERQEERVADAERRFKESVRMDMFLKDVRENAMTQKELGLISGVSQAMISKIEQGRTNASMSTYLWLIYCARGWRESGTDNYCRRAMVPASQIVWAGKGYPLRKVVELMQDGDISQLPIYDGTSGPKDMLKVSSKDVVGWIKDDDIVKLLLAEADLESMSVSEWMKGRNLDRQNVKVMEEPANVLESIKKYAAVLVIDANGIVEGLITKADVLKINLKDVGAGQE